MDILQQTYNTTQTNENIHTFSTSLYSVHRSYTHLNAFKIVPNHRVNKTPNISKRSFITLNIEKCDSETKSTLDVTYKLEL